MSSPALFEPIAQLLERSLSIRHVYGEPVNRGDVIVIPVARVTYGFGAGGGHGLGRSRASETADGAAGAGGRPESQGEGGGGGVHMMPVGALEIGPQGTRFIHYRPFAPLGMAAGLGLAVGWLLARRRA